MYMYIMKIIINTWKSIHNEKVKNWKKHVSTMGSGNLELKNRVTDYGVIKPS